MTDLTAAPPLETPRCPVGRSTIELVDRTRADRRLAVDLWYPALVADEPLSRYEVLPGIAFEAAVARRDPHVASGSYPLIVLSHGRTGMRFVYAQLAEALAGRGSIVVACDHPGDALHDWLGGTFVDDRTNEVGRVADASFLLDTLGLSSSGGGPTTASPTTADPAWPQGLAASVDPTRVAIIGHSYGAYTALAAAAGVRGVAADARVRAVVGVQPYTRTLSDAALGRVHTPTLLVVSEFDQTAPADPHGERPWQLVNAEPTWRLDLGGAAHHASSDMGLYLELAATLGDLPPMLMAYVAMMSGEMIGPQFRPWRERLLVQVGAISAFLDIVLDIDPARGEAEAALLAATNGVTLQRR